MDDQTDLTLSHKINRLFAVVHPRSAPERSIEAVAEHVTARLTRPIDAAQLERLRSGELDHLTDWTPADLEVLAAIAQSFGVAPDYLTTTGTAAAAIDRELELLATMRDANVASIALRGGDIDQATLTQIIADC